MRAAKERGGGGGLAGYSECRRGPTPRNGSRPRRRGQRDPPSNIRPGPWRRPLLTSSGDLSSTLVKSGLSAGWGGLDSSASRRCFGSFRRRGESEKERRGGVGGGGGRRGGRVVLTRGGETPTTTRRAARAARQRREPHVERDGKASADGRGRIARGVIDGSEGSMDPGGKGGWRGVGMRKNRWINVVRGAVGRQSGRSGSCWSSTVTGSTVHHRALSAAAG